MSTFTLKPIRATMPSMTDLSGAALDGAVVIITGAGRGIGRAHAPPWPRAAPGWW